MTMEIILDWMDARSIAELILDEHPQIIALVISYLDFGLGADVLGQLPDDQQADVIARIATLQTVQPDAIRELEEGALQVEVEVQRETCSVSLAFEAEEKQVRRERRVIVEEGGGRRSKEG